MGGTHNVSQTGGLKLRWELAEILTTPQDHCMVAIPDMNPKGPKYGSWKKYEDVYPEFLNAKLTYYSAFISRPDSAPQIDTPSYYDGLERLWAGHEVVLVRGSERSLVEGKPPFSSAARAHAVVCPYRDAYAQIDRVEAQVVELGVKRVILCAGAMATVLAYRLSKQGFHAIDLGHIGMFWRRYSKCKT